MSFILEWIGHSCVLIHTSKNTIIIDPFLDQNPKSRKTVENLGKVDLILLTHGHFDHISEAIPLAIKNNAPIVCVPELSFYLKKMGKIHTIDMGIGGLYSPEKELGMDGIVSIKMVSALHSSSIQIEDQRYYAGLATGFIITLKIENKILHLYHAGDTALSHEMKDLKGQVHLAMLPIDGRYNMGIQDVQKALDFIQPEVMVPIHYNTFPALQADPTLIKNPYGRVCILDNTQPVLSLKSL